MFTVEFKFDIKLVFDMSQMIFKQEGVRSYTALETLHLLRNVIWHFWSNDMWSSNSPDLNLIENL